MMKNIIFCITIAAITLAACNSNKSTENKSNNSNAQAILQPIEEALTTSPEGDLKDIVSVKEILTAYLQIKNAFTEDNSTGAAAAGKKLEAAFKNFNKSSLTEVQKKTYEDVEADAREHAEHIGANGGNIEHQREHFELISNDIYDLVKSFGGDQVLYKDFCPMYNNGKGAFWLSEIKEIKNPYFGGEMPTCGTVKEELK